MSQNPLVIPILHILKQSEDDMGEYQIIQALQESAFFSHFEDEPYDVRMFKKHFMTMNALYHLQGDLFEEDLYLSISPLKISIQPVNACQTAASMTDSAESKLRDYYLDWTQFDNTGPQEIENLLTRFWQKYLAQDHLTDALTTLQLDEASDWTMVQARYRRLAAECHPDRGGAASRFIEIREAYEVLKRYHQA